MAGYFSQLAKNTGLTFGHEAPLSKGPANAPETRLSQATGELPSPLGIEEVAFTVPPASEPQPSDKTARNADSGIKTSSSLHLDDRFVERGFDQQLSETVTAELNNSQPSVTQFVETPAGELDEESAIGAARSQVRARDSEAFSSTNRSVHRQRTSPPTPDDTSAKSFESQSGAGKQPAIGLREREIVSIAQREKLVTTLVGDPAEETEQDATVRDYLKEVLAWVAATPERAEPPNSSLAVQPANPERVEIQTRDERSSLAQPAIVESMAQDLNLSIGNISIVVEESRQNAAAQVVTPLRNDRSPEPATSGPTRLSRYYLRGW